MSDMLEKVTGADDATWGKSIPGNDVTIELQSLLSMARNIFFTFRGKAYAMSDPEVPPQVLKKMAAYACQRIREAAK